MQAAVRERYTTGDALELRELERPEPAEDEVLVRVRAAAVNPIDWYELCGVPYVTRAAFGLRKPKSLRLGGDFAGVVESAGRGVRDLAPGDEVYGITSGAFAEYVVAKGAVERKPANITFEEAAAAPTCGLTALQGLRDHAAVQAGQHVLVNGAAGGVGTFAVQVAKALGAKVTAVCSTRNVEQSRALGADRVIDYTREDFARAAETCDVVLDVAGNRAWRAYRRALAPGGVLVLVGGPRTRHVLGPLGHIARMKLAALPGGRRAAFFVAKPNGPDLAALRELIEAGRIRPVVAQTFAFDEVADALLTMRDGHAPGKVVVALPSTG
jgi:NADPH:quinone reductase-like Zn-dependent oxidoreductase